jgi:hypothetical protein
MPVNKKINAEDHEQDTHGKIHNRSHAVRLPLMLIPVLIHR